MQHVVVQERSVGDAKRYNDIIRHETLRVAVCDMLEGVTPCPESLRSAVHFVLTFCIILKGEHYILIKSADFLLACKVG